MTEIHCTKLNKKAEALNFAPLAGELGEKILKNISKEAWQSWLEKQTMLINEYKLDALDPKANAFLKEQMKNYLFHNKPFSPPAGFVDLKK